LHDPSKSMSLDADPMRDRQRAIAGRVDHFDLAVDRGGVVGVLEGAAGRGHVTGISVYAEAGNEYPHLRMSGHAGERGDDEREKKCSLGHWLNSWWVGRNERAWAARVRWLHQITSIGLNRLPLASKLPSATASGIDWGSLQAAIAFQPAGVIFTQTTVFLRPPSLVILGCIVAKPLKHKLAKLIVGEALLQQHCLRASIEVAR
jgi:hypothetical protein